MPAKRDLIGLDEPADGFQWSDVRWDRILSFFGGIGLLFLYGGSGAYNHLPEWLAAGLVAIPVGLAFYGATEQSPRDAVVSTVAIGAGLALGNHPDAAGLVPFV